jgi:beta-lactamase class D
MKKLLAVALTQLVLSFATIAQSPVRADVQTSSCEVHFKELNIDGSIIILHLNSDLTYEYNQQRNKQQFPPASTFKILNALIALETKVVNSSKTVFTWDGIVRFIPEWNQDLDMERAFKLSAIWYYQVLARKIGHSRMRNFVEVVNYGNKNIGAENDIDNFWLEGKLKISPRQQIEFLKKLYREELPFSKPTISTVKTMMIIDKTDFYTMRVKTGWVSGGTDKPQVGWYVGYLENGGNRYLFATNIDIKKNTDGASRKEVTYRCLKTLRYL